MQRLPVKRNTALLAMLAACTAVFLTAIDQTVVVTALPQIITDLGISPTKLDQASWIVSGYLLGYVIVMPLMGRVSDIFGRRRIFVICLSIFALGSLLCGLSPVLGGAFDISFLQNIGLDVSSPALIWLVVARFIQAAGGGAMVPIAMAIAGDFYGYDRRAIMLGLIGMVTEAGGVLGPLYGSLIVQSWGWQAIFYLNLPIVAVLLVLVILLIPASRTLDSDSDTVAVAPVYKQRRVDTLGALVLGASLICLSLGLAQQAAQITPQTANPGVPTAQNNPWLIAAAVILLLAFVALELFIERRQRWPIIALSLFKRPAFSAAALVSLLVGAALIIAMVDIPIFFISVLNRSALDSGLALLRLTALIPVGALLGGWLCSHITCRWTAIPGLLLTALGFWLMHLWPVPIDEIQVTFSTTICGLGLGLVIAPISTTAINAVQRHQLGMGSSVITVLRMIGMILGLAGLTSWGLGRFRALAGAFRAPAGIVPPSATYYDLYGKYLTASLHDIYTTFFLAAGIICLLALVPAILLEGKKPSTRFVRSTDDNIYTSHTNADSESESEAQIFHGQRKKQLL